MTKVPVAKKINAGIYSLTVKGISFEIERMDDGAWMIYEMGRQDREYITDRAAIACVVKYVA